jgi:hypothetical protein
MMSSRGRKPGGFRSIEDGHGCFAYQHFTRLPAAFAERDEILGLRMLARMSSYLR